MRIITGYLIILLLSSFSFSQENSRLTKIMNVFEEFEYSEAIRLADSILLDKNLAQSVKNEILLIKAISHYSLSQEALTRKSFIEMIKNDRNLQLDSNRVSPKILSLFLSVKEEFHELLPNQSEQDTNKEGLKTLSDFRIKNLMSQYDNYTDAIYKSILLPGWGHYSIGQSTKGIILSTTSLVNLSGIVFFAIDARKKEKVYLSSIEAAEIQTAYSSYNKSYYTRNVLIASFIAIWLYAQIDFLINGKTENIPGISIIQTTSSLGHTENYLKFNLPIF